MPAIFLVLNEHKNKLRQISFTLIFCLSFLSLFSQKKQATSASPSKAHVRHTVLPRETFRSIGKLYGISGEQVANYNNLEYYEEEVLAKYLTIPLPGTNNLEEKKPFSNGSSVAAHRINGTGERIVRFKKNNGEAELGYSAKKISKADTPLGLRSGVEDIGRTGKDTMHIKQEAKNSLIIQPQKTAADTISATQNAAIPTKRMSAQPSDFNKKISSRQK